MAGGNWMNLSCKLNEISTLINNQQQIQNQKDEDFKKEILNLQNQLKEKDKELNQKDNELKRKNNELKQKDKIVEERDLLITKLEKRIEQLTERNDQEADVFLSSIQHAQEELKASKQTIKMLSSDVTTAEKNCQKFKIMYTGGKYKWKILERKLRKEMDEMLNYIEFIHGILESNNILPDVTPTDSRKRELSPIREENENVEEVAEEEFVNEEVVEEEFVNEEAICAEEEDENVECEDECDADESDGNAEQYDNDD